MRRCLLCRQPVVWSPLVSAGQTTPAVVHADRRRPGLLADPHNPDGTRPRVTSDQWHDDPMEAGRRSFYVDVPCGACGAERAKPCLTASGRRLASWPHVHAARQAASESVRWESTQLI